MRNDDKTIYQVSFKGGEWSNCSLQVFESLVGNWDFEMRKLTAMEDDVPMHIKRPRPILTVISDALPKATPEG